MPLHSFSSSRTRPGPVRFLLRLAGSLTGALALILTALVVADLWVGLSTRSRVISDIDEIPDTRFGVILGTSKYYSDGLNPYYTARIDAAVALFERGRIEVLLASGDNLTPYYDEPGMIRDDLVARGVPTDTILQDGAGSRTIYSVRRLRSVYEQETVIIVSQPFHLQRALYQAQVAGLNAWGFAASDPPWAWYWRVRLREVLARASTLVELHLLDRAQPGGDTILP